MTFTKQAVHRVYVEANCLSSENDNARYISVFLFNCVLKGIVMYEKMTLTEKQSLNIILADDSSTYHYDQKTKQIKPRNSKNKEVQS